MSFYVEELEKVVLNGSNSSKLTDRQKKSGMQRALKGQKQKVDRGVSAGCPEPQLEVQAQSFGSLPLNNLAYNNTDIKNLLTAEEISQ